MSTKNKTNNLKLPQYTEEDIFDMKEVNEAYKIIDESYKEQNDNYKQAIETSTINGAIDNLELIDARKGKRTLGEKISEIDEQLDSIVINIKKYGAKGDGSTNDTEIIQRCIDKVAEYGGYVYIPSGCYMVTQLVLKSNVIIKGSGYNSQLKQIGNTSANMIILETPTTHTCGLENLYINGNRWEQVGVNDCINFVNSSQEIDYEQLVDHYITLRDIHIEKCSGNGLVMKYGREIVIDNVTVRQCANTGMYLNISDSKISNCTVSTSNIGYHFDMGGNVRVVNSKAFVCSTGYMINSYGASCNLISNVETQSCTIGYHLKNSIAIELNNFVSDSEDFGIILENVENCNINGLINCREEWGGNNKVAIKNKGEMRNTHININRYFNTKVGYTDLVDEYDYIIPTNTIKVNNQEIYNINCFHFNHFESVENNCFNTLELIKSDDRINVDLSYKFGETSIIINSNPELSNWGSIELVDKEFRTLLRNNKISLSADFNVVGNLTPAVTIQYFGDDGYSRGKSQGYLLSNNKTSYLLITPTNYPEGATKFKVSVGFNFPQTTELNGAINWGGSISNINFTVY